MKYASDYYGKLKLAKTRSNMNQLCWELEHWQRQIRWKRTDKEFDWTIMVDPDVTVPDDIYQALEQLYRSFCRDMKATSAAIKGDTNEDSRKAAFGCLYDKYRAEVQRICSGDWKVAANALILIGNEHPSWNKKFPWVVSGSGIVQNIKQVNASMPERDPNGQHEYLGRRYSIKEVLKEELLI